MRKFNLKGTVLQKMKELETGTNEHSGIVSASSDYMSVPSSASTGSIYPSLMTAWRSDIGKVRKTNQDAVIHKDPLYGIADGMGGHNGGETASQGLRDGLIRELEGKEPSEQALQNAVQKVNSELFAMQENDPAINGMGTTLTALWMSRDTAYLCQVGDSRAYLIRDCEMKQITEDHSMVADMVRKGILTEEQASCHPMRNYITRAIATDEYVQVDTYQIPRHKGDRWLICSDGLYGQMSRLTLSTISAIPSIEEAADRLQQEALENGGKDNLSFILLDDLTGSCTTTDDSAADGFPVPGTISGHDASSETEIPYSDSSAHSDPDPFPKPNPVNHKQEENRDD